MEIKKRYNIYGLWWKVKIVKEIPSEDPTKLTLGKVYSELLEIHIARGNHDVMVYTLFHEFQEIIDWMNGFNMTHSKVCIIGSSWYQIFKDNLEVTK